MKYLRLLFLIFVLGGFSSVVNAQADCIYRFRLYLFAESGKVIKDAQVEFWERDLSYDKEINAFSFSRLRGCSSNYKVLLKVSSEGFNKFEKKLN